MAAKKTLVIVESPSKAKTIAKFLGGHYKVLASVGHVRDLPKSKLGIDIENEFEPQYISIRGKGDIIKELKKEAKNASKVYLATDPDREGEAISWHLAFLLGIDADAPCRIVFNEITEKAIKTAIKSPRPIDIDLVDAQQARRVVDRLVGYQISPLLWRKIRRGLSAGRVQSAALKILCDRENEIKEFKPEEFWNITAEFEKEKNFTAKLTEYKGNKISIENKEQNDEILKQLDSGKYVVSSVEEKERMRKASAPFTTSSLQQDAANKLNFSTRKTMMVAQQLYEGVEIKGRGTVGLVSYIRTDSVRISDEARAVAREYIETKLGAEYYGGTVYSNKKKDVQDAHEAIRPSYADLEPDAIKDSVTKDQYNLYKLIWNRFIASQMAPAKFMAVSAVISNGDYDFKAVGSKLLFDGFLKIYTSAKEKEEDKILPDLATGEELKAIKVEGEQNFTQPPSRFTEASLVKELEDKNIGRPSTYAPIVATLLDRKYISKDKKSLVPTELGFIVIEMMAKYFKEIVDVSFTAQMEDDLDDIEIKGVNWRKVVDDFYGTLKEELEIADKEIEKVEFEVELTGENCELCGKPMAIKYGRFGSFAACTGYPECKNTKPLTQSTGVKCPKCGKDIVVRKSKRGRVFYGCSGYPACDQSYWNKPINKECPKCGELLVEKKGKDAKYVCSNSACDYKE
ncbi:MAG: type I DNA topoisomerase [Bacillota bacterium]|nr:type I DNA topoisomerase [Bacillota bacterium]